MGRAMRSTSTVVLPVPAPAMTSMGPWMCSTASCCEGLRTKIFFMAASRRTEQLIMVWAGAMRQPGKCLREVSSFAFQVSRFTFQAAGRGARDGGILRILKPAGARCWGLRCLSVVERRADGEGGDGGGLGAEDRGADGGRGPACGGEGGEFFRRPTAFRTDAESNGGVDAAQEIKKSLVAIGFSKHDAKIGSAAERGCQRFGF